MGYERNHAIIVSSCVDDDTFALAHAAASNIFGARMVSQPVSTIVNEQRSFLIGPDGSKEGWSDSAWGDRKRNEFVAWLESQRYKDGSSPLKWVEVQYGDEELDTKIVRDSDAAKRDKESATPSDAAPPTEGT